MNLKLALIPLLLALPAMAAETTPAAATPAAAAAPAAPDNSPEAFAKAMLEFATAVESCTEATSWALHPFVKDFVIQHRILGSKDGKCVYSQTMPGQMRMECALTDEGKTALAAEFREQAAGRMSGSTAKKPVWSTQCEIVAKDGKRTPMAG